MNDTQLTQISRYIEKARQDLLTSGSDDTGALLFMGEMQDPIPRTLIIDPSLNAIDVRIWMLLRISIANPILPGKLPTQKELSASISSSKMTLWSSMQILRLNRWITLCDKVRDSHGQNRGNIYAIHTEPMAIADTLQLDNLYIEFIEQSLNSKISRVKNNAMAAHIDFYKQINNHENTFNRTQLQQHEARLTAFQSNPMADNHSILSEDEQNYYAHNFSQVENSSDYSEFSDQKVNLSIVEQTQSTGYKNCTLSEMAQQSHSLQGTKIDTSNSSGSSIYKRLSNTTTTTTNQAFNLKSFDRFKSFVRANEIPIAERILLSIPESDRQDVLDQILGRLVNYRKTGKGEIFNLIGFLQKIKVRVHSGEFQIDSHALMIRQGREAEERQVKLNIAPKPEQERLHSENKPMDAEQQKKGIEALSTLKKKMRI